MSTVWAIVSALVLVWQNETDPQIKNDLGAVLRSCLAVLPDVSRLMHPLTTIELRSLRREVAELQTVAFVTSQLAAAFHEWGQQDGPVSPPTA